MVKQNLVIKLKCERNFYLMLHFEKILDFLNIIVYNEIAIYLW